VDLKILVGGEAGQGVQTVGAVLSRTFTRAGCHVFADQDYESRIRGGHNFFRIRIRDSQVMSISEQIDVLIALNRESMALHCPELDKNGIAITDEFRDPELCQKYNVVNIPMQRLALEKTGNKLSANSVAMGATMALLNLDVEILLQAVRDNFTSGKIADDNVAAAKAGYTYVIENIKERKQVDFSPFVKSPRLLLNGNEAVAAGALAAGCKYLSAYPMTPSTSIIEFMAARQKDFGTVVFQPEDEIAAIHNALGASYAGVRSMTVTSGGGFCLMVEGLGLSAMTETPVVIVLGQRPGPAIGLPTRTEQGDLQFALHASHGDFPRVVLAPSTAEDAFWLTIKSFNLAERYQLPVIVLTDHYLATSYFTVEKFDTSAIFIDRGLPLKEDELGETSDYKRHRVTGSGISPRALPMFSPALVVMDSDEHNEEGHLIEDAATRVRMVDKRMKKLSGLRKDIAFPLIYGPKSANVTLVGWGSTFGPLYEASQALRKQGLSINLLHFTEIWPFPNRAVTGMFTGSEKIFVVENNVSGQFASLFVSETGLKVSGNILKYDGRPFTSSFIMDALGREDL